MPHTLPLPSVTLRCLRAVPAAGATASAVDDPANLAQRVLRRCHPPRRQFGRDPGERLVVLEPLRLQLPVTPPHETLRGLGEVAKYLRDNPRCLAPAERTGADEVLDQFRVNPSGAPHRQQHAARPGPSARILPGI